MACYMAHSYKHSMFASLLGLVPWIQLYRCCHFSHTIKPARQRGISLSSAALYSEYICEISLASVAFCDKDCSQLCIHASLSDWLYCQNVTSHSPSFLHWIPLQSWIIWHSYFCLIKLSHSSLLDHSLSGLCSWQEIAYQSVVPLT